MTLNQLRVLLEVQKQGSLLAAASTLKMSRTTASQLVNRLEIHCEKLLLIRTPQGTRLTATGQEIAKASREILALTEALEERVAGLSNNLAPLRIQLPVSLPEIVHSLALQSITQHLPDVEIEVQIFTEPDEQYSEDVHLRLQFSPAPRDGPFRTFLLGRIPVQLVASPSYIAEHGRPGSVEALAEHRLLLWHTAAGEGRQLPCLDGSWLDVSSAIRTTDAPLLRSLAARGEGIALVPCPRAGVAPPWQVLETLLPDVIGCEADLRAIVPERLAEVETTRALIAVTRDLSALYTGDELTWHQKQ